LCLLCSCSLCVCVLRSLTIAWKICLYLFGVWILRSALLRSTTLNYVDHLEHLISKVNWVNFEINSVLPSLLLVFVEKVLTCLFTPPLGNFQCPRPINRETMPYTVHIFSGKGKRGHSQSFIFRSYLQTLIHAESKVQIKLFIKLSEGEI
jgi:hypothetical protein